MRGATASALTLALLLVSCGVGSAPQQRLTRVSSQPVGERLFSSEVEGIATLEALQEVELAAQVSGRIERLLVRQGDRVRRGRLLLQLDQAQLRADVARLRAEMDTNRQNYLRFESLLRQGAASPFQGDEYRQRYVSTRREWEARSADLALRELRAPIDGIVADLRVKQGDLIQAGNPFTGIIRNDRLLARMEVPAIHAAQLRPGLSMRLIDPASGRPLAEAPLVSIDPGVDSASQTLLVKGEVRQPGDALRNGLRLRAQLVLQRRQLPAVPFAAVTRQWGQSFVFRLGRASELGRHAPATAAAVAGPVALQTPVQLGPLQAGWYPVLSGLPAGSQVITSQLITLRHGQPVRLGSDPAGRGGPGAPRRHP
jgi:RND family efflux transporter MFP subunit